jgi:hypothetical protein
MCIGVKLHNGLYADSLDVLKWSEVADVVKKQGVRQVLYIAMLTDRRATSNEGRKQFPPAYARQEVRAFFDEERKLIRSGQAKREARRVTELGPRCVPPFDIEMIHHTLVHSSRDAYFSRVQEAASELAKPVVALFDPDTGFASTPSDERYLATTEVSSVTHALPVESVVMVYQHRGMYEREAHCKTVVRRRLAEAVGCDLVEVIVRYANDVALAIATIRRMTVELYSADENGTNQTVSLAVASDGRIQMSGQDLGAAPLAAFGQHEYEYELSVEANASPQILTLLLAERAGTAGPDRPARDSTLLMQLLAERYRGDPSAVDHFREWLKAHEIEHGFWNRMGD